MQTMGSWGRKYKLVLTLHDLIYYTHRIAPPSLPLLVRIAWRIYHLNFWAARLLLNRADAVVTVSATSKDLIKNRRLTSKPVHVIYNAADSHSSTITPPSTRMVNGRRQLVDMGSFMPYKNVECLIEAIKVLEDFELVLLSKISSERKQQLESQVGKAIERVRFVNGVSDQEYLKALDGAFALVSASKDEGFGIPLVEAMSRGIPVVVSDIPIFREVGAEAGKYFDPESSSQLASAVLDLQDARAWTIASEKSLERSAFFNWDDSAKALLRALG
jgi:glycosyltransferase involved in cell wall biosynthesis